MYAAYFGLTERPFSLAPDPRYLYLSDAHREALAHLLYGIGEGGSFVQLTGEVGTGKTTVCRALLEQLPPDVDVAMIFNPRLTSVELLAAVCDELRVTYPAGTTSLKVLVDALSQALLDAHAKGRRTVLIIDEAQNLSARVLEEVRLLTNLETTTQKLLQVVLIGQPELAELLARRNLRQLSQRVTARYHLRSFSEEESQRYVQHRLEIAGQRQPIFTKQAVRAAHRLARGIPRLLNTICDRALLGAYATGQTRVKEAVVRRAAKEVLGTRRSRRWVTATAAAVLLVVVASTIALVATGGLRSLGAWAFSRAEKSISPPVDAPALAPVVDERRPPEPTLAAILGDPSLTADRASAFVNLYALWGLDASERERGARLRARARGRIAVSQPDRHVDGAASSEPSGDPRAHDTGGTEVSRRRWRASTATGRRSRSARAKSPLPSSEVERFWDGPFTMIWRSPVTGPVPLQPGMSGRDVSWLRHRLGALDGQPATARANQIYDDELKRRVAVFQQGEALVPDGIAGEETLVRLVATASGANGPTLTAERP